MARSRSCRTCRVRRRHLRPKKQRRPEPEVGRRRAKLPAFPRSKISPPSFSLFNCERNASFSQAAFERGKNGFDQTKSIAPFGMWKVADPVWEPHSPPIRCCILALSRSRTKFFCSTFPLQNSLQGCKFADALLFFAAPLRTVLGAVAPPRGFLLLSCGHPFSSAVRRKETRSVMQLIITFIQKFSSARGDGDTNR